MKKLYIYFLFLLFTISSCEENNAHKAKVYNDSLIKTHRDLTNRLAKLSQRVSASLLTSDKKALMECSKQGVSLIDSVRQEIKDQPTPNIPSAEDFRKGMTNLLLYYKLMFQQYDSVANANSKQAKQQAINELNSLTSNAHSAEELMREFQKSYAKLNGAQVQEYY